MIKQTLYEKLEKRRIELEEQAQIIQADDNTAFIIDFYNKNDLKNPWVCKNIDEDKLFYWAISVMTYYDKTPLSKELYELNKSFFKRFDIKALCSFANQLEGLSISMKLAAEKSEINMCDPKVLKNEWQDIKEFIKRTMQLKNIDTLEKIITLKLTKDNSFDQCMFYLIAIKEFKSVIEALRKKVVSDERISTFDIATVQEDILKENIHFLYKSSNLDSWTDMLISRYEKINAEYIANKKQAVSCKKKAELYMNLPQRIDALLTQEEIVDYKDLVEGLDENIKTDLLTLINEHNQRTYKNIEASYIAFSTNDNITYKLLLNKYGITSAIYGEENLPQLSIKDTETFLNKLTDLGIKEPTSLSQILKIGSIQGLDKLSKYIKKGIIKPEFAQNNPSLFDITSEVYKNATNNIEHIIAHNITPTYIMENQEILLIPAETVNKSIETLEEYELKSSLTIETPVSLFSEKDLNLKLDTVIEHGYEETLRNNLSIASYSRKAWKKIELLRQMNIEVSKEDLEDVLRSNTFIVGEDQIENYITRALSPSDDNKINSLSPTDVNISNPLESYSVSPLSYNIDEIIVSRKKVQRNLKKLANLDIPDEQKLLLSIQNNMSITSNELSLLKQSLGIIYK